MAPPPTMTVKIAIPEVEWRLRGIEARQRTIELLLMRLLVNQGEEMSSVQDLIDVARAAVLTLNRLEDLVESEGTIDQDAVNSAVTDLRAAVDRAGTITADAGSVTAPQDNADEPSSAGDSGAGSAESVDDGSISEDELQTALSDEDQGISGGVNARPGDVDVNDVSGNPTV